MSLFKALNHVTQKVRDTRESVKVFLKDPMLWAGVTGLSTVLGCAYGEPDICAEGERQCMDNYAMICDEGTHFEGEANGNIYGYETGNIWYAVECEIGCSEGKCIDGKVINEDITGCPQNAGRCRNGQYERCLDGIWFKVANSTCIDK